MLIASRHDGQIPNDPLYLKRVAYLNTEPDFKPLIDCGFVECASTMLATSYQSARPETETEAYKKRQRQKKKASPKEQLLYPDWLDQESWGEWKQHRVEIRKPMTALAEKKGIKARKASILRELSAASGLPPGELAGIIKGGE